MTSVDDALYAHLEAINFFPPKGKVSKEEEVVSEHDLSQEKMMKMKALKKKKKELKREVHELGYESDSEAKKPTKKRKRPALKIVIPLPPSPLKTEPPSPRSSPSGKRVCQMMNFLDLEPSVAVIDSGTVERVKETPKKKKKKTQPDLWKTKRNQIMKIRKSQEDAREARRQQPPPSEKQTSFDEKTVDNYFYMQSLSGKLEVMRHALLVEEIVTAAKVLCIKECDGCRDATVSNHGLACSENASVLMQLHVEAFIAALFATTKDGDYYIDERFAMLIDNLVPEGFDIREEYSFPTYVLQQYFKRLNNPKVDAALKKLGLDLPLNGDVPHGIDSVGVMPTMLSVLCAKQCLTPLGNLIGW